MYLYNRPLPSRPTSQSIIPYLLVIALVSGLVSGVLFRCFQAISRFSEAVLDYVANIAEMPDTSVTTQHFQVSFNVPYMKDVSDTLHGQFAVGH